MEKPKNADNRIGPIVLSSIDHHFSKICNSTMAMLSYFLTPNGKLWWKKRINKIDELLTKISSLEKMSEDEQKTLESFDLDFQNLKSKITELCSFLKLNN